MIVRIELDLGLGLVAVMLVKAFPGPDGFADKYPHLIGGADVAIGDEFQVFGVVLADQNAALITRADEAGLNGIAVEFLVAEIGGRGNWQSSSGREESFHKVTTVQLIIPADHTLEIGPADFFLFRRQIDSHDSFPPNGMSLQKSEIRNPKSENAEFRFRLGLRSMNGSAFLAPPNWNLNRFLLKLTPPPWIQKLHQGVQAGPTTATGSGQG